MAPASMSSFSRNPASALRFFAQAFTVIDKDGSGVLDLADITAAYDASKHPEVIAGKKTKAEVFREFLDNFDGGEKDGMVYIEEFERYYATISASIDDDDYFEVRGRCCCCYYAPLAGVVPYCVDEQ